MSGAPVAAEPSRVEPSTLVSASRVIAVLRAPSAAAYRPVVDVLVDQGIVSIELTMTTPGTLEVVEDLVTRYAGRAEVGVGTVTDESTAERALDRGAAYLVTPTVAPAVIAKAVHQGRPVFPGAFTPSEVHRSWSLGATAVKLFPASHLGPSFAAALRGPFPQIVIVPSGGVRVADIPDWLGAGALAVSLGSELLGDAFRGGDLRALAARADQVRAVVDECGR